MDSSIGIDPVDSDMVAVMFHIAIGIVALRIGFSCSLGRHSLDCIHHLELSCIRTDCCNSTSSGLSYTYFLFI